jgi:hypothetical protein
MINMIQKDQIKNVTLLLQLTYKKMVQYVMIPNTL